MVTGVNSMGGGGALASSPSNGHSVAKNNNEMSGISIIEPVKRSGDNRRSNKPIMEKRRRARINNCLNELKALILDANKKDPRHSKFEKADILEKTVKHLQDLQRQQSILTQATDPSVLNKFKAGFAECASEVGRFTGIDPVVRRRLLQHLSNCINGVKSTNSSSPTTVDGHVHILPSPPSSPDHQNSGVDTMGGRHPAATAVTSITVQQQQQTAASSPLNHIAHSSNGYFLTNGNGSVGVQLIPTKLTNGNIAFVVPHGALQHQQLLPTASGASAASSSPLQQLPIQSNTPLPMLIPIPIPSRHSTAARSSSSGNSSSSSSCSSSSSGGSNHSLGHSTPPTTTTSMGNSPRRITGGGQYPYGSSSRNVMPSSVSPVLQQRHVTSSPYDRSTETPTSNYGSMSPVNSHNRRSPIEQMDCQPSPVSSMGSPISPPCSPQSASVIVHQTGRRHDLRASAMTMMMDEEEEEAAADEIRMQHCHSPCGPLSLVVRKSGDRDLEADSDKQCWRPW